MELEKEIDVEEFKELMMEVKSILEKEEKIVEIKPKGEGVIIGDIHGDYESLKKIFEKSNFSDSDKLVIFLGDYGDRGGESVEVFHFIFKLKQNFPERVFLLRGNHEGVPDMPVFPHDLPLRFTHKFSDKGKELYTLLLEIFRQLPLLITVPDRYLFLHGGIPTFVNSIDEMKHNEKLFKEAMVEILWNDPMEEDGREFSPRGIGYLFGKDITKKFLEKSRLKTLVRGHQPPPEGVRVEHEGMILTISSTHVYGGKAAFLPLNLEEVKDAFELKKISVVF